ncbi:recombination protein RecR [bacterium]|jgi:recombination protein RecR|nr:recombination protein RecR [bacterium]MBT6293507.1 recombination protein RecR [bacterium]
MENQNLLPVFIDKLINQLNKLPGIGSKTAQRLALSILKKPDGYIENLVDSLNKVNTEVRLCNECQNYCESDLCLICQNEKRNPNSICVVEDILDLIAIENSGVFKGKYFVLHGLISPLNGVLPSNTKVDLLCKKLNNVCTPTELILSLNSTSDGDATCHYINESLKNEMVSISKLASGLPFGSDLDYLDSRTLSQAIENRKSF